jgi:hypothetical protein
MYEVLSSTKQVILKSKHVKINDKAISLFTQSITHHDFEIVDWRKDALIKDISLEDNIALTMIYGALNFSYWGDPKWKVSINNKEYGGAIGMLMSLKRAFNNYYPITKPNYLSHLSHNDMYEIFKGNTTIPMFRQRLELIQELAKGVLNKYNGKFSNVIFKAKNYAPKITELLAQDFPTVFNDEVTYNGSKIKFYKRAQLVPADLFDLRQIGIISLYLTGYENLTAFADYKVPQSLRKYGILQYSDELANKVDHKIELQPGSQEEIEIRAATIWAIELATRMISQKFPEATPAKVDNIFWGRGQIKSHDDKPYHRVRTIWY